MNGEIYMVLYPYTYRDKAKIEIDTKSISTLLPFDNYHNLYNVITIFKKYELHVKNSFN